MIWKSSRRIFPCSFGVTKDFPFRPFMNLKIHKLREKGVIDHGLIQMQPHKYTRANEVTKPITIEKVVTPFAILCFSFALSVLLLVCEFSLKTFFKH